MCSGASFYQSTVLNRAVRPGYVATMPGTFSAGTIFQPARQPVETKISHSPPLSGGWGKMRSSFSRRTRTSGVPSIPSSIRRRSARAARFSPFHGSWRTGRAGGVNTQAGRSPQNGDLSGRVDGQVDPVARQAVQLDHGAAAHGEILAGLHGNAEHRNLLKSFLRPVLLTAPV